MDYLNATVSQVLLKYLLISHFGRGRGRYTSPAAPQQWSDLTQAVVQSQAEQWAAIWTLVRDEAGAEPTTETRAETAIEVQHATHDLLQQSLQQIMAKLYPMLSDEDAFKGEESAP